MLRGIRFVVVAGLLAASSFIVHADLTAQSESADIQIQLGQQFLAEGRYQDAVRDIQRVVHRFRRHMRQVDHHAKVVHRSDNIFAERREAIVACVVGARVSPT